MPSAVAESSAAAPAEHKEKPHKKSKSDRKEKKRHRDGEADEDSGRKHKRSKSEAVSQNEGAEATVQESDLAVVPPEGVSEKKSKKDKKEKKKKSSRKDEGEQNDVPADADASTEIVDAAVGETKKEKKEKKKDKKRRKEEAAEEAQAASAATDAMDIDSTPAEGASTRVFGKTPEKPYPFFTQTVSQYLPLYPFGMIDPVEGYTDQYLKPLLNRYVPTFRGVLLAYRNPRIGEAPGKAAITAESEQTDEVLLESVDEYAVSFGWLTAEVDLFKPTRGAWMEGTVNLQSEGHLGVVCWGKFNAAIEASRLPQGWRWIDLDSSKPNDNGKGRGKESSEVKLPTPEPFDEGEEAFAQLHTTGYWVDDQGRRVRDTIRFRIKNYEVGVSGEYGYLSIEGTMLDEEEEKAKAEEEMEAERRRKLRGGDSRRRHKTIAEFSVTKFSKDAEEEDEGQRTAAWRSSRPGSEE